MIPSTYKTAYRQARQGHANPDTIEGLAAILAIEARKEPEHIGERYTFAASLKDQRAERLEKRLKKAKNELQNVREMMLELASELAENVEIEPEMLEDSDISAEFNQLWEDR